MFSSPSGPAIGGLAYDPSFPDQVYAGLGNGAVKVSSDGGGTWRDLGRQDLGRLDDLALGIDGMNLYAATEQGVWRIRLMQGGPGQPQVPVQIPAGK